MAASTSLIFRDLAYIFAAAVLGGASDGGDEAVQEAYHAGLVAPFCLSAAKRFFDDR